uniref:Uncharacterized protein n=1 Tax=Panagrolaimus sp. PS1159 TaxID=55785 RepID=A0AC35GJD4_9BILA
METGITNMGRASTVKIKHKIKEQALPKMQWRQFKKNNFKGELKKGGGQNWDSGKGKKRGHFQLQSFARIHLTKNLYTTIADFLI